MLRYSLGLNVLCRFFIYLLAAVCPLLLSACVSSYPKSEMHSVISFPLPECKEGALRLAADQAARSDVVSGSGAALCVTKLMPRPPKAIETKNDEVRRGEEEAFSPNEKSLRDLVEKPFEKNSKPVFGLALSGGGTKASSFPVGVMAGLADNGLLDTADYISTVSGGGYAAYFYYAHRLFPVVRPGPREESSNADLHRDCVDTAPDWLLTTEVIGQIQGVNYWKRLEMVNASSATAAHRAEQIKYQAFLKCTQDVLRPGNCDMATTRRHSGISSLSAIGTLATAIPSWIPNILFDWGVSTSPSATTYRDGIGLSYGATVKQAASLRELERGATLCGSDSTSGLAYDCVKNVIDPDPVPMTFGELKSGLLKMNSNPATRLPFWIINAAAPEYRSSYGWLVKTRDDVTNSDMFG